MTGEYHDGQMSVPRKTNAGLFSRVRIFLRLVDTSRIAFRLGSGYT